MMDIPVRSHGQVIYHVKVNVTPDEHIRLIGYRWFKRRGHPIAHGIGDLFRVISSMRKPGENLYPELVPLIYNDVVVAYANVDDEDIDKLKAFRWIINKEGYAYCWDPILRKMLLMHRYLMGDPRGYVIDHIGWNRIDNRKDHLRICTVSENSKNITLGFRFGKRC